MNVVNKVEKDCDEIGIKFDLNKRDRVHCIGKPDFDTDTKQKVRSIIVKFKSWKSRMAFCKGWPKISTANNIFIRMT